MFFFNFGVLFYKFCFINYISISRIGFIFGLYKVKLFKFFNRLWFRCYFLWGIYLCKIRLFRCNMGDSCRRSIIFLERI